MFATRVTLLGEDSRDGRDCIDRSAPARRAIRVREALWSAEEIKCSNGLFNTSSSLSALVC
ncbi:MAG: hypothetical protein JWP89_3028 [Schlesneria sp.]|jgi:hypothetical protein|nr:hypothetical protein [Schlesneria sp.]